MISTRGTTGVVPGVLELQRHGMISHPGMGPYLPRVLLTPPTPANQQSATGVGVSTSCVALSTRGTNAFVLRVLDLSILSTPGGAGSTNPSQSAINLLELGFPHRAGRHRSVGLLISSPYRWSCIFMEILRIRGWDPILPGWC